MASSPKPVPLAKPVSHVPAGSLGKLRMQARECRACDLWQGATQTVFGEGPANARIMLLGEQPGDQEDQQGHPFVGPAGLLLREVLGEVGLDAADCYLTNVVKHFKFSPRGKRRLHQRANAAEQAACRPWLAAELARVQPRWLVALGATAAQTLFGSSFRVSRQRGQWTQIAPGISAMATWHPSALLRMREPDRDAAMGAFQTDLESLARRVEDNET